MKCRTILTGLACIVIALLIITVSLWAHVVKNICKYGFHTRHIEIDQSIDEASIKDNTFYVDTKVKVCNLLSFTITMEHSEFATVSEDKVKETAEKQMHKCIEAKKEVQNILYRENK